MWDNEKSKNRNSIVFFTFVRHWIKSCTRFSELQVFGFLSSPSSFILYCPSVIFQIKHLTNIFVLFGPLFFSESNAPLDYITHMPNLKTFKINLSSVKHVFALQNYQNQN